MRNVYMVLCQGNVYRDVVRLGMLRHLLDSSPDIRVILLTQAWAVPEVRREIEHERIILARHDLYSATRWPSRLIRLRQVQRRRPVIDLLTRLESLVAPQPAGLPELFAQLPPSLVVSTHPYSVYEWDVISFAHRLGVPTAGIMKSWDNILRLPQVRPRSLAVWGRTNFREAVEVTRYREDELRMVGAMPFDRYFTPGVVRPRTEFWQSKGLDPSRPVVLFGTAGAFSDDWDETFMLELLLKLTEQCDELRDVQFVCRLHPITHLEYFWPYRDHPRVVISFGSYVKTLGWCMTKAEVDDMANMLCNADLVITPASTLSVEAPIFDTPTVVTLFSSVAGDTHARRIEEGWLKMHFKPIVENDWLPLARTAQDLKEMMIRSLRDRSWYREGRCALVDQVVTLKDGKSYERAAKFITDLAV
jgi:hypothetical protein